MSFGREEVSNDLANDKSAWKLFIKTRLIHVCVWKTDVELDIMLTIMMMDVRLTLLKLHLIVMETGKLEFKSIC